MTKRWLIGTLTTSVLLWLAATGLQGAKPSGALPLDVDFGSDPASGLYGDGLGRYIDGSDNVRAVLLDNDFGNFVLDTNDNARLHRRLVLDFHGQPGLPSSIPSNGAYSVDVFLGTLGVTGVPAADGDLRAMSVGQTLSRRARIGWVEGTKSYSLRWDNTVNDNLLRFDCELGDPSCYQWKMTPDGPAGLYSITSGKNPTEKHLGSYTMPFSATLTPQ